MPSAATASTLISSSLSVRWEYFILGKEIVIREVTFPCIAMNQTFYFTDILQMDASFKENYKTKRDR